MNNYDVSIDRSSVAKLLTMAITLLLCASFAGQVCRFGFGHDYVFGMVSLFNVDAERNIPTFFTMLVALGNALILAVIAVNVSHRQTRDAVYWVILSVGFVLLAYDEGFQLHEKLTLPMRQAMGATDLGIFYFGWVVPGIAGVCALGLLFIRFLLRLPVETRRWMLIAGGVYVCGCIGMELVGGKYMETYGHDLAYVAITTIEEGLEMAGLATLMFALLGHIATGGSKIALRLAQANEAPIPLLQAEFN